MTTTVCIAEDRKTFEPAIKLLVLSLSANGAETEVNLFYPAADDHFRGWLKKYPFVRLQVEPLKQGVGWNVKPVAIRTLLDRGYEEVIWIDSDIVVTRNLLPMISALPADTLVASEHTLAEERGDPNGLRARSWGLIVGRTFPFALSSGVVRITRHHYRLMERWWELLQSETYLAFQRKPWRERPYHLLGDQDVLTALLASSEFSQIPTFVLRRGKHIIQFDGIYGYSLAERLRHLLDDCPGFVHSGASKPWLEEWKLEPRTGVREYIKRLCLDLSPYTSNALQFRDGVECDTTWMDPHYISSRVMRVVGMGKPALVGLPLALLADLARVAKYVTRSGRVGRSQRQAAVLSDPGTVKS